MELKALGFLQPDFAKVPAPTMVRIERWQDLALEARVARIPFERFIVAGLDTPQQLSFARQVEIPYGQGSAIATPQAPPPLDEGVVAEPMPDPLPQEQQAADEPPQQDQRPPTVEGQSWTDGAARLWNVAEVREAGESPADED
jgi:predicted component of type VI protein secretion system